MGDLVEFTRHKGERGWYALDVVPCLKSFSYSPATPAQSPRLSPPLEQVPSVQTPSVQAKDTATDTATDQDETSDDTTVPDDSARAVPSASTQAHNHLQNDEPKSAVELARVVIEHYLNKVNEAVSQVDSPDFEKQLVLNITERLHTFSTNVLYLKNLLKEHVSSELKRSAPIIMEKIQPFTETFQKNWAEDVKSFKEKVAPLGEELRKQTKDNLEAFYKKLQPAAEDLREKLRSEVDSLRANLAPYTDELRQKIIEKLEDVKANAGPKAEEYKAQIAQHLETLKEKVGPLFADLKERLLPHAEEAKAKIAKLWEAVRAKLAQSQS
ncbi:uncharacterized protein ACNLHF_002096 [Anomaloglossus baeobatrachus]